MNEKIAIIRNIFADGFETESEGEADVPNAVGVIQHGGYYGGIHQGRKHMYSSHLIQTLSPEKLESFIRKDLGI